MAAHQKSSEASSAPVTKPGTQQQGGLGNARRAALPFRSELETAFGQDFSGIEVLLGVGGMAESMGANAAAVGAEKLVFADAQPSKELVAHELTHVVQQRGGPSTSGESRKGDTAEREAGDVAKAAARGEAVKVEEAATGKVQGDWGDVGRVAGGILLGPALGPQVGEFIGDALEEDSPLEELEAFQRRSFAPLAPFMPPSGGMFDVSFDAASLTMRVQLGIGFSFVDGDASAVAAGFRPEEFVWEDAEKGVWKADYLTQVMAQWSGQHTMRSTKSGWEHVGVNVEVLVVESADPHFMFEVAKYPSDADMAGSSVCAPGTHHDTAPGSNACLANEADEHGDVSRAGMAQMDSNDMRPEGKLDWGNATVAIPFGKNTTELDAAGTAALQPVRDKLTTDATFRVTLLGRASNTHPRGMNADEGAIHNMDLARERSEAVSTELTGAGVTADRILIRNQGEERAGAGEEWCRVDAQLGDHQTQNPALHETGHMFGLGDEYPTASNAAGTHVRASYRQILTDQLGTEVRRAKDESAMSSGSTVMPRHYVTFLAALKSITGSNDWTV